MKGKKMLAVGLAAGMVLTMSIQAFADPVIRVIQAKIHPNYHITFDGEKKELPEGYEILVYQDRTYVPARYVAEELGATVTWDEETKEIGIVKPKVPETPVTSDGAVKPSDTNTYSKLPVNKTAEHFRIAATAHVKEADKNTGNKLALSIKNTSNDPITLDQTATTFTVNGTVYQVPPEKYHEMDTIWYQNIEKDIEQVGNLLMPSQIKDAEKVHVELVVKSNGAYPAWSQTVAFDIDLT